MKTISNPNFSIVMNGCNANCKFCFKGKVCKDYSIHYFDNLESTLRHLPEQFYQISITGGEPMFGSNVEKVDRILGIIRKYPKFKKVVLTTNGLEDHFGELDNIDVINHVNISRHTIDVIGGFKIFGVDPPDDDIFDYECEDLSEFNLITKNMIDHLNTYGIDVTLNCVVLTNWNKVKAVTDYIEYARGLHASAVCFRNLQTKDTKLKNYSSAQKFLMDNYRAKNTSSCPVCESVTQIINGMIVTWKSSLHEPSDTMTDEIYELIFHADGTLSSDWAGNRKLLILKNGELEMSESESKEDQTATGNKTLEALKRIEASLTNLNDRLSRVEDLEAQRILAKDVRIELMHCWNEVKKIKHDSSNTVSTKSSIGGCVASRGC